MSANEYEQVPDVEQAAGAPAPPPSYSELPDNQAELMGHFDAAAATANLEFEMPQADPEELADKGKSMVMSMLAPTIASVSAMAAGLYLNYESQYSALAAFLVLLFPYINSTVQFAVSIRPLQDRLYSAVEPIFAKKEQAEDEVAEGFSNITRTVDKKVDALQEEVGDVLDPLKPTLDKASAQAEPLKRLDPDLDIPEYNDIDEEFDEAQGKVGDRVEAARDQFSNVNQYLPEQLHSANNFYWKIVFPVLLTALLLQLAVAFITTFSMQKKQAAAESAADATRRHLRGSSSARVLENVVDVSSAVPVDSVKDEATESVDAAASAAQEQIEGAKDAATKQVAAGQEQLDDAKGEASAAVSEKTDEMKAAANEQLDQAQEAVDGAKDAAAEQLEAGKEQLDDAKDAASAAVTEKTDELKSAAGEQLDQAQDAVDGAKDAAAEQLEAGKEQLDDAKDAASAAVTEKTDELKAAAGEQLDQAQEAVDGAKDAAAEQLEAGKEQLDDAKAAATAAVSEKTDELKAAAGEQLDQAQEAIDGAKDAAAEQLEAGKQQLDDAKAQAQEQFDDAKAQAQEQLEAGKQQLDDAKAQAQEQLDAGKQQFDDAKAQALAQFAARKKQLEDAKAQAQQQLEAGKQQLDDAKAQAQEQLDAGKEQLEASKAEAEAEIEATKEKMKEEGKKIVISTISAWLMSLLQMLLVFLLTDPRVKAWVINQMVTQVKDEANRRLRATGVPDMLHDVLVVRMGRIKAKLYKIFSVFGRIEKLMEKLQGLADLPGVKAISGIAGVGKAKDKVANKAADVMGKMEDSKVGSKVGKAFGKFGF